MKLQILSDLHNEFSLYQSEQVDADVIVLAGDIWKGERGIAWARESWPDKRIIYIAGNHEFYGKNRLETLSRLRISGRECNVDFLDNDEVIIDDTRFLGATLWTDFKLFGEELKIECICEGQQGLNDFRVIHEGSKHFSPMDSVVLHEASIKWLQNKLETSFDGQTVVVTHHLPSFMSVAPHYQASKLSACFASRLDHLFDIEKVQLWIHGHTHDSFNYDLNGTRVICNPRGYFRKDDGNENADFNPYLVVDITGNGVEVGDAQRSK
jgi:predicted phosphodiesterase